MSYLESDERKDLRAAVAELATRYGHQYALTRAREQLPLSELWQEAGKAGFLGVNLPAEYGGGGAGLYELALVLEELAAAGTALLMMVVSPAICGTIIARYGTPEQKQDWLPGLADGSQIMAFGITEADAGSNSHNISTTARRDGDGWLLSGRKIYISGVDVADAVLIVGRTEDARTGRLKPALFIVPTDSPGFEYQPISLVGDEDAALAQLFAGLNPERVMAAAIAVGTGRYALDRAVSYVKERQVWGVPIGAHQGLSHPLAQVKIELELAKLMMHKAATLYDLGDDMGAGEAANMAKYAAAEASVRAVDQAVQSLGGNGLASEYGLGTLLATSRIGRVAPVSREMILNFVAQFSLGLPKSY
jgi:alkylation response protein AidB-like acyl-CoA dehydrogenase